MNEFIRTSKDANSRPLIVVKLGGSILSSDEDMAKAAKFVRRAVDEGRDVVVVVSAMKGVTDGLVERAKGVNPNTPPDLMAEIMTMGERISARLFAAALQVEGLEPSMVDPDSESWPIISSGDPVDAEVLYEETERSSKGLLQRIEGRRVPVVCGFIGKTPDGRIQALGRGGSDTTAVVLASALGAEEVVLVKDVGGVMSGDPRRADGVIPVDELDSEEVLALSLGGSKLIHHKAFRYLRNDVKIRVVGLEEGIDGGTVIEDAQPLLAIEKDEGPISMITVVGNGIGDGLGILLEAVRKAGGQLVSLSLAEKAAILYVKGDKDIYGAVHEDAVKSGIGKAVSLFEGLARIVIKGKALETIPGYISRVVNPLTENKMNIYGLYTIASSVRLFVDSRSVDEVEKLIRVSLEV